MRTEEFEYHLPPERIAQRPAEPRDSARLMVLDRQSGCIGHHRFRDLPALLSPRDLLVANDSRVILARLQGRKETGGRVEVLLLRPRDNRWEALVRGRVRPGQHLIFRRGDGPKVEAQVESRLPDGLFLLAFDRPVEPLLGQLGQVPLPPYIREPLADAERYQTVYARVAGSAASPTAGLHFTPQLIDTLERRGIRFAFVTLHVGVDTFRPVTTEHIEDHVIHQEWCQLPAATAAAVAETRRAGGRIVAVGTTTVRVLETAARQDDESGQSVAPFAGWTDLYITPGFHFRVVDALITNFHFPRSTLLMLVAAFAGKQRIEAAYAAALEGDYRFYSFGDAMLIR